jgi:CubicO group peptidase (beta-lactamase class C family)
VKKYVLAILTFFILLTLSLPGYTMDKDLEAEITRILEENNTTAASIAIIESDGSWHTLGIGVRDKTSGKPVDADTLFRIGSVSKIFTSLAILKLVEEDKLGLNDPIRDWVAGEVEYNNPWESESPVRIVHLLSHTTGWDDLHMSEYAHNDPTPVSLRDAFLVYPKSRTSRWVPGSRASYSNSGPGVAAYIVEKCTGQLYEEYVDSKLFKPLGMNTATFFQSDHYMENSVTLYENGVEQPYWHIIMRPSGAINASANDMIQLLLFFINSSNQQVLSEETIVSMRKPQGSALAESGLEVGLGLSHFAEIDNGYTWQGHSGGVNGGLADFRYIPELGLGYYVAINSNSGTAIYDIMGLLKTYLTEDITPPVIPYNVDTTVDTEELAGYFRVVNPRNSSLHFIEYLVSVGRVETRPEGIALVGILDGSVDLYAPVSQSQFVDPLNGKIALTITEDPLIGTVLHNEWFTLKPVSFLSVYGPLAFIAIWLIATLVIIIKTAVLLIQKLRKKQIKGSLWTHLLPLLQILSLGLFIWGFIGVATVDLLADNRFISGLIAYGTILFLFISVASVIWFLIKREKNFNYYQSLVYSFMNLTIGIYFTVMGVTGFHFF